MGNAEEEEHKQSGQRCWAGVHREHGHPNTHGTPPRPATPIEVAPPTGSSPPLSASVQTGSISKALRKKHRGTEQGSSFARGSSTKNRHRSSGTQPAVNSKAMSSRSTRRQRAATARSEDLGFSSGAKKDQEKPLRRLQEGNDICGRRRRIPRRPRVRVSPRQTLPAFYTEHQASTSDTLATVTTDRTPATPPPLWPRSPTST